MGVEFESWCPWGLITLFFSKKDRVTISSVDDYTKRMLAIELVTYKSYGHPCGATYLKSLIQKADVGTKATAAHIRRNLNQLTECIFGQGSKEKCHQF